MRQLLLLLALSLPCYGQILAPILSGAPASGAGTITFVQNCNGVNVTSNSDTLACTGNATAGNAVFVAVELFNSSASITVTLSDGGACTATDYSATNAGSSGTVAWYRCIIPGSPTITGIHIAYGGTILHAVAVGEFSASAPFVQDATGVNQKLNGLTWDSGNLTTTNGKKELILGMSFNYSNNTAPTCGTGYSPFGSVSNEGGSVGCYQIVSSTSGTYHPNGPNLGNGNNVAEAISYKVN